jgi:hypothetical protein
MRKLKLRLSGRARHNDAGNNCPPLVGRNRAQAINIPSVLHFNQVCVNRMKAMIRLLAACATLWLPAAAMAEAPSNPCDQGTVRAIPARASTAPDGSAFARRVEGLSEKDREDAIETELMAGNMPPFLRRLLPVNLPTLLADGRSVQMTICVLPDYLAIGSDPDFLLVPMRLATALKVAGRYGFTLPTARMVDAIYEQAVAHLAPQPLPAGAQMRSTDYYLHHTQLVREQQAELGVTPGMLTAGDKKDIVITNRLWSNLARVAIYGWHRLDHKPIQPLSTVHGAHYADYSHGVRLISDIVYVDGQPESIFDALANSQLARSLSGEGPIQRITALLATLITPPLEATPQPGTATVPAILSAAAMRAR